MGGKNLIVMIRRQVTGGVAERPRLLNTHHDGVGEAAQQHHQTQHHVHDADLFVVDTGEPLFPQIAPDAVIGQRPQQGGAADRHDHERCHDHRVMERNGVPGQTSENQLGEIELLKHVQFP